jgi:hypothetical protein
MNLDRILLEIPFRTGYTPQSWKTGIDCEIPKKEGSNRVTKLRTILLFEADCNHLFKVFGRRRMHQAEKSGTIAPEQYGSRKHKSSILHAVNKQLSFDIIRQQKSDAALLVLDAKSCYDCISPPIASLALKRQGAPQSMIDVLFLTLDEMTHFIRTAYGDSDITYCRLRDRFHGIGQGNGAGPMIWVMVSTPILNRMQTQGLGASITNPDTDKVVMVTAFAFVDDTDIVQQINNSLEPVVEVQECLNNWNDGLLATGGALVGSKSNWYMILHEWRNNKWSMKSMDKAPGDIKVTNPTGLSECIKRLEPHESVSALGIMFTPNGSMKCEVAYIRKKAEKWTEQVCCGFLKKHEAWYSINLCIMKSIEYPLLATTMSKCNIDFILAPILSAGLPKMGVCRNISRKLVFSTFKYQGLGLVHPFILQGLRKLLLMVEQNDSLPLLYHLKHTSWAMTRI